MSITQERLNRTVSFLKEIDETFRAGVKPHIKSICTKHHLSTSIVRAMTTIGYLEIHPNSKGGRHRTYINRIPAEITPYTARLVLEELQSISREYMIANVVRKTKAKEAITAKRKIIKNKLWTFVFLLSLVALGYSINELINYINL